MAVWPEINERHRPDLWAYQRKIFNDDKAYKWPSINKEDLVKPREFLIFLNSRARSRPADFAHTDRETSRFGLRFGGIRSVNVDDDDTVSMAGLKYLGYAMKFQGQHSPETYGQLIKWTDDMEVAETVLRQLVLSPASGFTVLEIQEWIYKFLLGCCLKLLQDMNPDDLIAGKTGPVQPDPGALTVDNDETSYKSLVRLTRESQYRLGDKFDVKDLKSLIVAEKAAAEDHLWALRDDPSYFVNCVLEKKEHQTEMLLDINGKKHSAVHPRVKKEVWAKVVGKLVAEAYCALVDWDEVLNQITKIESKIEKYSHLVDPERPELLPEDLMLDFLWLDRILLYLRARFISIGISDVAASPPVRPYFHRMPEDYQCDCCNNSLENKAIGRHESAKPNKLRNETWKELQTLLNYLHEESLSPDGDNMVMDQLQKLIDEDVKTRDMLTDLVYGHITNYFIVQQLRHQLSSFQPWAASFMFYDSQNKEFLNAKDDERMELFEKIVGLLHTGEGFLNFAHRFDPTDGKFSYPIGKKRTQATVSALQSAEKNLAKAWNYIDKVVETNFSQLCHSSSIVEFFRKFNKYSTPAWTQEEQAQLDGQAKKKKQQRQSKLDENQTLVNAMPNLHQELEYRTESTVRPDEYAEKLPSSKEKPKGFATPEAPKQSSEATTPGIFSLPDQQPAFTVNKRSYKVFSALFPRPDIIAPPGEVLWKDFLSAMHSTGFEIEKLYGSVWKFTPTNLDVERSIHFHEPHPSPKVPFVTMRRFGRRLYRAYGWHAEMFISK
jgi:hypothetical protein